MMLIDCDACAARGAACAGCMMSAVLDTPAAGHLEPDEHRAIETLTRAGFHVHVLDTPPARPALRLVPVRSRRRIA
jgi:hypothetical protein